MLYIFWVEKGSIITLQVDIAVDTVNNLKSVLTRTTGIAEVSQVLLINGGESLRDGCRVAKYQSGTDTNPIFLFHRDAIESDRTPDPTSDGFPQVPDEMDAKESVEAVLNLPPNFNSIVSRTQLAQQYHDFAKELNRQCSVLVQEQHLQHQGWQAVMANLDDVILAFKKRLEKFQVTFQNYLSIRSEKLQHLSSFSENIEILGKLPLFPALIRVSQTGSHANQPEIGADGGPQLEDALGTPEEVTILDWISAKDADHSLQTVAEGCRRTMETFDESTLDDMIKESRAVIDFCNNSQMREIKGLAERLFGLDQLLSESKKQVLDQKETADVLFRLQQQTSSSREPQMFKDVAANFSQLLHQMLKCHKKLFDIKKRCLAAKQELCSHLHVRLKWVITVENSITEVDDKIKIYYENIKRIKRLTHMLDQVRDSPSVYVAAVQEVLRRRHYAADFTHWADVVSETATRVFNDETELRKSFLLLHGSHFLLALFPGLDQFPPQFATTPPGQFDSSLPPMTEDDLKSLLDRIPRLQIARRLDSQTMMACPFTCQSSRLSPSKSHPDAEQPPVSIHTEYDVIMHQNEATTCSPAERRLLDHIPGIITASRSVFLILRASHQKLQQTLRDTTESIQIGLADLVQQSQARFHQHEAFYEEKLAKLRQETESSSRTSETVLKGLTARLDAEIELNRVTTEQLRLKEAILLEFIDKEGFYGEELRKTREEWDFLSKRSEMETDGLRTRLSAEEEQHEVTKERLRVLEEKLREEEEFRLKLKAETEKALSVKDLEINELKSHLLGAKLQSEQCVNEFQLAKDVAFRQSEEEFSGRLENEKKLLAEELQLRHQEDLRVRMNSAHACLEESHRLTLAEALKERDVELEKQLKKLKTDLDANFVQQKMAILSESRQGGRSASTHSGRNSPDVDRSGFSRMPMEGHSGRSLEPSDWLKGMPQEEMSSSFPMDVSYMATTHQPPLSDPVPFSPRMRNLSTGPQNAITLSSCNMGDLVLFVYNKEFKQYTAYLPFKRSLYLLHSDSHVDLALSVPDHDGTLLDVRSWVVAEIVGKEYVLTKKVPNRYRLQVGTKFYRVKAKSWDLENVLKEASAVRASETTMSSSTLSDVTSPI